MDALMILSELVRMDKPHMMSDAMANRVTSTSLPYGVVHRVIHFSSLPFPLCHNQSINQISPLLSSSTNGSSRIMSVLSNPKDIAAKIVAFSKQGPRTVCVLSANGSICNVSLQQPALSSGVVNYEVLLKNLSLLAAAHLLLFHLGSSASFYWEMLKLLLKKEEKRHGPVLEKLAGKQFAYDGEKTSFTLVSLFLKKDESKVVLGEQQAASNW